jgi:hypothetical protein
MRPVSACRAFALSATCLLGAGCVAPPLVLLDAGDVYLTDGLEEIRVERGDPLTIRWEAHGSSYSTAGIGPAAARPVKVRLVEANDQFLRLRSPAWQDMGDIPAALRTGSGIRVTAHSGRYGHPTVSIPVDSITAVAVDHLLPRRQRVRPRDALYGMGAGATWAMALFATDADNEDFEGEDALAGTVIGGLIGTAAYPAWRLLRPGYGDEPDLFVIEDGPYRLEIRRR